MPFPEHASEDISIDYLIYHLDRLAKDAITFGLAPTANGSINYEKLGRLVELGKLISSAKDYAMDIAAWCGTDQTCNSTPVVNAAPSSSPLITKSPQKESLDDFAHDSEIEDRFYFQENRLVKRGQGVKGVYEKKIPISSAKKICRIIEMNYQTDRSFSVAEMSDYFTDMPVYHINTTVSALRFAKLLKHNRRGRFLLDNQSHDQNRSLFDELESALSQEPLLA